MKKENIFYRRVENIVAGISSCAPISLAVCTTTLTLLMSILMVYLFSLLFGIEYTMILLTLSIILPSLLTPPIVLILIRLTKHLEQEREKNTKNDIILFEQARFVVMGEMLTNISHQWKQPLNTINLSVIAARMSGVDISAIDKYFDIIEDNVNYLASTLDDFMSFVNKKNNFELRGLESIIKEIKSIIEAHLKSSGVNLSIEINAVYGNIAIASSISQVILNLINNAKDAFDKNMKDKEIQLQLTSSKNAFVIFCCDNGKGVDLLIQDKIFEPYFTTKSEQNGSGIGLYMSKQIVEKVFGGELVLLRRSKDTLPKGMNTCFKITIPYSDKCSIV